MSSLNRAEVRPSATNANRPQPDSYTAITETRSLLAQALTRLDEDRQAALSDMAAATNRLGERTWPTEHPAGRALELLNHAIEAAMVDKRDAAREQLRESMQLLDAAEVLR